MSKSVQEIEAGKNFQRQQLKNELNKSLNNNNIFKVYASPKFKEMSDAYFSKLKNENPDDKRIDALKNATNEIIEMSKKIVSLPANEKADDYFYANFIVDTLKQNRDAIRNLNSLSSEVTAAYGDVIKHVDAKEFVSLQGALYNFSPNISNLGNQVMGILGKYVLHFKAMEKDNLFDDNYKEDKINIAQLSQRSVRAVEYLNESYAKLGVQNIQKISQTQPVFFEKNIGKDLSEVLVKGAFPEANSPQENKEIKEKLNAMGQKIQQRLNQRGVLNLQQKETFRKALGEIENLKKDLNIDERLNEKINNIFSKENERNKLSENEINGLLKDVKEVKEKLSKKMEKRNDLSERARRQTTENINRMEVIEIKLKQSLKNIESVKNEAESNTEQQKKSEAPASPIPERDDAPPLPPRNQATAETTLPPLPPRPKTANESPPPVPPRDDQQVPPPVPPRDDQDLSARLKSLSPQAVGERKRAEASQAEIKVPHAPPISQMKHGEIKPISPPWLPSQVSKKQGQTALPSSGPKGMQAFLKKQEQYKAESEALKNTSKNSTQNFRSMVYTHAENKKTNPDQKNMASYTNKPKM